MDKIRMGELNTFGAPLAVCVNDCMLDYGQPAAELMRVCFQVRCAFAEMRWGRPELTDDNPSSSSLEEPTTHNSDQHEARGF